MGAMHDILIQTSTKEFGEYHTKKLKGFFQEGQLVKVYSHYSLRLFAIGENNKIFRIHHTDFGTIFFDKDEWRNLQIKKVLKK